MISRTLATVINQHCPVNGGTAACIGDQRMGFDGEGFKCGDRASHFFSSLGYNDFFDLDYNGLGTYNVDIGKPMPEELRHSCDFVFDGGVAEHVPDIFQAVKNFFGMVRVGGYFAAQNPINQYDGCYWNLNPEFYLTHLPANGFNIVYARVLVNLNVPGQLAFLTQRLLPDRTLTNIRTEVSSESGLKRLRDWTFGVNRVVQVDPRSKLFQAMKSLLLPENTCFLVIARKVLPERDYVPVDQGAYHRAA